MQHFSLGNHSGGCSWQPTWQAFEVDDFVLSTTYVGLDDTTLVNGACGSANAQSFASAPTANLCSSGTASAVSGSGSGPWTWTCAGSNGGTNASCAAALAGIEPDAGGIPGSVTDLAVVGATASSVTLSFTEVDDGAGQPASYDVRFSPPPMAWGPATGVSQGTCTVPVAGQSTSAVRTCTVEGLAAGTSYDFQLVAFRGTLQVNAVFGPLSNVAQGVTTSDGGLDAGRADASAPGPDAGTCVPGGACSSNAGCRTGTMECVSGQPQCAQLTNVADGTACQGSNVCYQGQCLACPAQEPCHSADGCQNGTISCATGQAVCESLTNASNGTACGVQGECQEGVCSYCPDGTACTSLDGCQAGSIDCSQAPAVCGGLTNRPDGVACSGGVCKQGACRACTPGAACNPLAPCKLGSIVCGTGEPVCEVTGNVVDGTLCPGGTCQAGTCQPAASADAGTSCGAGTQFDPATGTCVASGPVSDAGLSPPREVGCGCAAGAGATAPLFLLAGLLAVGVRRRGRQ
ncbi:MAG: fibronectin type III domain-containing protein [Deltaproteobacteria bacterium]|nr:fibronectin type III domain-containing protein [Deltaproteobacteria bacterium]